MVNNFNDVSLITTFITKLLASPEWLALQDKTQVFNERKENVKSRGSHCQDVGDISLRLVEGLNGDILTEIRARLTGLIHDLGHIPFGHAGESVAHSIIKEHSFTEEALANIREIRTLLFGREYVEENPEQCFEHNENSVIQFITLCKRFGYIPDKDIMLGILAHSTSRYKYVPETLVTQAVRLADKLAYINYDVDDLRNSFPLGTEERKAIDDIYKVPLRDPDGNEIRIPLPDGRKLTLQEFVMLSTTERINILVNESIRDAQEYLASHPELQSEYETYLTGCNDIMARIAELRDQNLTKEQYELREKELKWELLRRSPIMYLAYEVKGRSDAYIRTGKGLTINTQKERTFNAQSAVGNFDLKNEYIYKSLVTLMEDIIINNRVIESEPLKTELEKYGKFKDAQNDAIIALPGNQKGIVFPEIYTIVNFIGIHSNTELIELAEKLGIIEKYNREVLPLIQAIQKNESLYDSEKGVLTSKGRKVREAIVTKYGAKKHLSFGLEEEDAVPTIDDEMIELLELNGYTIGNSSPSKSKKEILEDFRSKQSEKDQEYIEHLMQTLVNIRKPINDSEGKAK